MNELSSLAKESRSNTIVKDLERFRSCTLQIARRRAGLNGLSVCNGNVTRKIELKTVDRSDDWFAINGTYGIESLFFDPQYYLYFVLINENKVLIAQAIPFLQAQIPSYRIDVSDEMREWLGKTRALSESAGLNIIPRINFKLRLGIRKLIALLESGQGADDWRHCVDSIWHHTAHSGWQSTFPRLTG
ncbi:MAG TPA: hypothetical protein VN282_20910 [Pyrinomonadaceae bacterium]|nr:hypothetical protein [Pyrinomonadaceae bacterium]